MVLAPYYPPSPSPDGRAFKFGLSHPRRGSPGLALLLKGPRGRAASAWRVQCALTAPSLPVIDPVVSASVRWHPPGDSLGRAGRRDGGLLPVPPGVCAY
jgi:hypothetical protein